jgi:protein-S-isoprenylcysteine O-methyltransferase Ste14
MHISPSPVDRRLFARYAFRETLGLVVMGAALFSSAGTFIWWPAWSLIGVMAVWIAATAIIILQVNPDLLAERLGPRRGAKRWDVAIMSLLGLLQLARYIAAGLDLRNSWTGSFPLAVQMISLIVCALGYALVVWATASNTFFSQIARIQSERGHTVVTGGPYRTLRHPAYLGAILYELAAPVLLASWWAFLISIPAVLLIILRTALEDRMLLAGLNGYRAYSMQVRYRLVPGVW